MANKKINLQSKSGLARLLAVEDLHVIHDPSASTASFNVKDRVVSLPVLKDMSGYMYDAFIAHEISHALHTPAEGLRDAQQNIPHTFINITEDARIEKLIQRRYPGTVNDFYKFYKELASEKRDFFGLKKLGVNPVTGDPIDIDHLSLIDRINLHFKIGSIVKVNFKMQERKFVRMVDAAETFQDAVDAAKAIYEYMDEKNQAKEVTIEFDSLTGEKVDDGDGESGEDNDNSSASQSNTSTTKAAKIEVGHTQDQFDKQTKNLIESPSSDYDIAFGDVSDASEVYKSWMITIDKIEDDIKKNPSNIKNAKKEYTEFLREITPTINMMVNQFNMRKSADEFSRIEISKSGALDMKSISLYKTQNDIFLRHETIPESKNHGMVMFIDWSASMDDHLFSTIKQLITLTEFCMKVNIPFEVYAFTSNRCSSGKSIKIGPSEIFSEQYCSVAHILSSSLKRNRYRNMCANILTLARHDKQSQAFSMGGTPLTHIAFLSEYIVRDFKEKYKTQKTSLILLSDGDPTDSLDIYANNIVMRNPDSGHNYSFAKSSTNFHDIFGYVRDRLQLSNLIGIYVTDSFGSRLQDALCPNPSVNLDAAKIRADFKSNNYTTLPKSENGFDKFFVISVNNFNIDKTNYLNGVDGRTSENSVKSALKKQLRKTSKSMIFMRLFIQEIS